MLIIAASHHNLAGVATGITLAAIGAEFSKYLHFVDSRIMAHEEKNALAKAAQRS